MIHIKSISKSAIGLSEDGKPSNMGVQTKTESPETGLLKQEVSRKYRLLDPQYKIKHIKNHDCAKFKDKDIMYGMYALYAVTKVQDIKLICLKSTRHSYSQN